MSKAAKPTLVTLMLSTAALCGYLAYRALLVQPSEHTVQSTASSAATSLAARLPDFSLSDLSGRPLAISSWPDHPLLINFWATWCGPCLREIPMLKEFQTDNPDLQVVGIAVDRLDPVLTFAEEMQFNYPVLVGEADAMNAAAAFGVDFFALPFSVFVAADGSLLGVHTGEIHAEHLENLVAVLKDLSHERIDVAAARARLARLM